MEEMTKESIYKELECIKEDWMEGGDEETILQLLMQILKQILKPLLKPILEKIQKVYSRLKSILKEILKMLKKSEKESQNENQEFVSENRKYLTIMKNQYPKEFERIYWNTLVCVKRNDIFQNTVYGKMLPVVTLCISVLSMMLSVTNFFPDSVGLKVGLTVVSSIAGLISITMFIKYIWFAMKTREFSYYEIMLSILEDLRNAQEEALSEEKPRKYVVAVQSCSQEDRPASTYNVTIRQKTKDRRL